MKGKKRTVSFIWRAYLALLLVFVVIKFRGSFSELEARITATPFAFGMGYNLIPCATVGEQLAHFHEGWARLNLFGNIVPFLPFGFLLPLAHEKANSWKRVFEIGVLSVLLIELFQFFTRLGSFDVDDILLNMVGILCGYLLLRLCRRFYKAE